MYVNIPKQGKPSQRFDSLKQAAEVVGVDSTTVIGALKAKQESADGFQQEICLKRIFCA